MTIRTAAWQTATSSQQAHPWWWYNPPPPKPQEHKKTLGVSLARHKFRNNVLLAYTRHLAYILCALKDENKQLRQQLQVLADGLQVATQC